MIENESSDYLSIPSVSEEDTALYRVSINNLTDTVWSEPIILGIADPPTINNQLADISLCAGSDTLLTANYNSEIPVSNQWFSTDAGLLNQTGDTLYLEQVQADDQFSLKVMNSCGSRE